MGQTPAKGFPMPVGYGQSAQNTLQQAAAPDQNGTSLGQPLQTAQQIMQPQQQAIAAANPINPLKTMTPKRIGTPRIGGRFYGAF